MKAIVIALATGALFALGLVISGMASPAKVVGFLDVTSGHWDPTLAFVMGGAILVHAPLAKIIRARRAPLVAARFHVPPPAKIDVKLLAGSAIFGIGWGLSGYCPGPALVGASSLATPAIVFVGAHIAGTFLTRQLSRA